MRRRIEELNLVNRLEVAMEPALWEKLILATLVHEVSAEAVNAETNSRYPMEEEVSPVRSGCREMQHLCGECYRIYCATVCGIIPVDAGLGLRWGRGGANFF